MVNWESQSKTLPQLPEDGHIYDILIIRIVFCHVSQNLPLHCSCYVTMNIYFCFRCQYCTWRRYGFAYICQIFITLPTHFHMHIQRHTHTSTHVQSAHERNGDNQAQKPGWEGRKKGFVRETLHTTKKCQGKTDIHESKEKDSST